MCVFLFLLKGWYAVGSNDVEVHEDEEREVEE
jgi:hypothetical protein